MKQSHFHEGELALQKKYNAWHDPRLVKKLFKDHIQERLIPFIEQQTTLIVSTSDTEANIWASMLIGEKGLVRVTTPQQIDIRFDKLKSTQNEVLFRNIQPESKIGILFINTATRSRYRLNGTATLFSDRIEIKVLEAYPNCPKYIQQRVPILPEDQTELGIKEQQGTILTEAHRQWIKSADTFFLASSNAKGDMDASHRGGPVGFIELLEDGTLKIPDYVGNNLFNTFGNFLQYPKAGLLFMDFENGHSLQLTGATELVLDQETNEDLLLTTGTGRYWLFKTHKWVETQFHNKLNWELISFSPFNPVLK